MTLWTWLLSSIFQPPIFEIAPDVWACSPPGNSTTFFWDLEYGVAWNTAPSIESIYHQPQQGIFVTMLPISPIIVDHPTITSRCFILSWLRHSGNAKADNTPMNKPPAAEARNPIKLTPPFVPGGTIFSVVIRIGGVLDRMPSSDAHVSAVAAA